MLSDVATQKSFAALARRLSYDLRYADLLFEVALRPAQFTAL